MTEEKKRKGNYNQTKNPRIIEARKLRKSGATDEDLSNAGFTAIEISRSFVPYSSTNYQRCRTCGCKAIVDLDRVCMGCQMTARMEREFAEKKLQAVAQATDSVMANDGYIDFHHPAIIRRKN